MPDPDTAAKIGELLGGIAGRCSARRGVVAIGGVGHSFGNDLRVVDGVELSRRGRAAPLPATFETRRPPTIPVRGVVGRADDMVVLRFAARNLRCGCPAPDKIGPESGMDIQARCRDATRLGTLIQFELAEFKLLTFRLQIV